MAKKKITKNLANCTPREFLVQTNKIRKSVEKWLKVTEIMEIRRDVPKIENIPDDATPAEIEEIMTRHKEAVRDAGVKNLNRILDSILDKHPDETLELLALLSFIETKDIDDYSVAEMLRNVTELLNDEDVIGFFTSLMRWAQTSSLVA